MAKRTPDTERWQRDFFERPRSPATAAKHDALERGFAAFLTRGPQGRPFRTVFDAYAGAGRFAEGPPGTPAEGSPLLLLRWARAQPACGPLRFVFSEPDALNFARLRAAMAAFLGQNEAGPFTLGEHTVDLRCRTFAASAGGVLAEGDPGSCALFTFVDPYGFEGLDFDLLAGLVDQGDLVLHVASHAIYTKLAGTNGEGARQSRRMDRVLGGPDAWATLRTASAGRSAAQVKALIAERVAAALVRGRSDRVSRIVVLRDGESHVISVGCERSTQSP